MKSYQYLRFFSAPGSDIYFMCTDQQTEEWILSEVKKLAPDCKLVSHGLGSYQISNLKKLDVEIGYRLTQQLCQKGWEPFAASGYEAIHFRLELT